MRIYNRGAHENSLIESLRPTQKKKKIYTRREGRGKFNNMTMSPRKKKTRLIKVDRVRGKKKDSRRERENNREERERAICGAQSSRARLLCNRCAPREYCVCARGAYVFIEFIYIYVWVYTWSDVIFISVGGVSAAERLGRNVFVGRVITWHFSSLFPVYSI